MERSPSKIGSILSGILVILSIGALAVALTRGAKDFANERATRLKDVEFHSKILNALEAYFTANQFIPTPSHPDETVQINGVTFRSGGAAMLYQVLCGDGNDQIAEKAKGGTLSDGTIANDDPEKEISTLFEGEKVQINGKWMLVDSYGHPVQFQKGRTTDVLDPKYDVWLYGGDIRFTDRTDAKAKRDPAIIAKWIRNFNLPPSRHIEDK